MTQSAPPPATHSAPPPVMNASAPQQKPAKPPPSTAVSVNIMHAGQKDQRPLNVESFDTADLLRK